MSIRKPILGFRKVAAAGAAVAVSVGLSVIAVSPAAVAESAVLNYTCSVPGLVDGLEFTATADTNAPAKAFVNQNVKSKLTTKITIDEATTSLLSGPLVGAEEVSGTGQINTVVGGAKKTVSAKLNKTAAPASGPMTVTAVGVLPIKAKKAGNLVVQLKDFTASLTLTKADGTPASIANVNIDCVQDSGQDSTVDTVKAAAQAKSKTKAKMAYAKKSLVVSAKVKSKTKATGKVKFVVTKNGKKFKAVSSKLNGKGLAKAKIKKVAKGKYVLTAKYSGSRSVSASVGKAKRKV